MERPNIVAESLYGPIIVNINDHIGKEVIQNGYWSINDVKILRSIAEQIIEKKGNCVFFDVGANVGTHTLALATLGSRITVHAFEAQRWIYYMLCGTVSINSLANNVRTYNVAVGETSGEVIKFKIPNYFSPDGAFGSIELVKPRHSDNGGMALPDEDKVSTITINEIASRVDLLKIDVEGMEDAVLRGGAEKIAKDRPVVFTEIFKTDRTWVIDFFKALNYAGYLNTSFDLVCFPLESGWGMTNMERLF